LIVIVRCGNSVSIFPV